MQEGYAVQEYYKSEVVFEVFSLRPSPGRDYVAKECQLCQLICELFSLFRVANAPSNRTLAGYLLLSYLNVFLFGCFGEVLPLRS